MTDKTFPHCSDSIPQPFFYECFALFLGRIGEAKESLATTHKSN
jgi:hypothetical protein